MKRFLIGLLSGILILAACTPVTAESTIPLSPTSTPTMVPATLTPSRTQIPPTRTVTPLPTIPTFTPTFDASTIVTVTPAAKAECPEENPKIVPDFPHCNAMGACDLITSDEILAYLNSGGTLTGLTIRLSELDQDSIWGKITDLNGDGSSEIVYRGLVRYDILGCKNGKYQDLFDFEG